MDLPITRVFYGKHRKLRQPSSPQRTSHFGLIHIDGNHDTDPVLADVNNYLPLLEPGGFLVMDDVSWPSVKPAVEKAAESADLILMYQTRSGSDDYVVLRKPGGSKSSGLKFRPFCAARGWMR